MSSKLLQLWLNLISFCLLIILCSSYHLKMTTNVNIDFCVQQCFTFSIIKKSVLLRKRVLSRQHGKRVYLMQRKVEKFEIVKMCLNEIIISLSEFGVSWMEMILKGKTFLEERFRCVFVFKLWISKSQLNWVVRMLYLSYHFLSARIAFDAFSRVINSFN